MAGRRTHGPPWENAPTLGTDVSKWKTISTFFAIFFYNFLHVSLFSKKNRTLKINIIENVVCTSTYKFLIIFYYFPIMSRVHALGTYMLIRIMIFANYYVFISTMPHILVCQNRGYTQMQVSVRLGVATTIT